MAGSFHKGADPPRAAAKKGRFDPLPNARMMDQTLLVTVTDAVATIVLNRPQVLNALNTALLRELSAALAELDADPAVRAIVLTGAGERAFAAGADIAELNALAGSVAGVALARSGQAVTLQMERMATPVIAAVNGYALGGGCELALAADIRIAAESAKFGQPEVNLGLLPGYGGTQRLTRLVGRGLAMYLCLSGITIDAAHALRIGLVQSVVPGADLLTTAQALGATIAAKAPLAVAATKRAIDAGAGIPLSEALTIEALHFGTLAGTADFREGTRAFLDKRSADFQAR